MKLNFIKKFPIIKNPFIREGLILSCITISLIIFYALLYKIYIGRINSFGCFDDCMNFGGAYFMLRGKELFSEIFFNHQPFMAYLSYLVQIASSPNSIFEFLTRHTQALYLFSLIFAIAIVRRFYFAGILFILVYEISKFYLFGNRFIAESFIVYPLVYMAGLIWYKYSNKKVYNIEYILSAIFAWFVIFMREPYIPLAFVEYFLIIGIPKKRIKQVSLVIFTTLSLISFLILPLREYLYSIFVVSLSGQGGNEVEGGGILSVFKIIFYPLYVFMTGNWNELHILTSGISAVFLILLAIYLLQKKYKLVLIMIILLSLANIRVVEPGTVFYESFHMIQWFGLILIFTGLMLIEYTKKSKRAFLLWGVLASTIAVYVFHPNTFLLKKADPVLEFHTNYGETLELGEIAKALSTPDQTFYVDHKDHLNLVYWQADRLSPYKYSWYTYIMPRFSKYTEARRDMIENYPSDFWYGGLDEEHREPYVQIIKNGKPSNLHIKKTVLINIPDEKWEVIKEYGYENPNL